jgi:hypothetical protein
MAAVVATGGQRTKQHYVKATLATAMHREHGLRDISNRLTELNDLRKDVSYGEPGADLAEVNLDDLVSELESFIDEVDRLIGGLERA